MQPSKCEYCGEEVKGSSIFDDYIAIHPQCWKEIKEALEID